MKLKNKKTGEIGEPNTIRHDGTVFVVTKIGMPYCKESILGKYRSLAELNEEWEDYEEPKYFYCVCTEGSINKYEVERYASETWVKYAKSIGNYFETKEEAELAVRKLKAWKRLEDKGFRFTGVEDVERTIRFEIPFRAGYDSCEAEADLDLLFGGEE